MSKEVSFRELFVSAFIFVLKHFKLLGIFLIIGMIAGFIKYQLSDPVYESKMTAISKTDTDYDFENFRKDRDHFYSGELAANKIRSFKDALQNNNHKYLSLELGISEDSIVFLKKIEVQYLYPISGTTPEKNMRAIDYLEVKVEVSNNSILPLLEQGIVRSINNDTFISEKAKILRAAVSRVINEIDNQVESIDKLQEQILRQPTVNMPVFSEKSIYSEKIELLAKKAKYEKYLHEFTPITVLTSFTPSNLNKNGLPKTLVIFVFIFGLAALIIAAIKDMYRHARKKMKQKETI